MTRAELVEAMAAASYEAWRDQCEAREEMLDWPDTEEEDRVYTLTIATAALAAIEAAGMAVVPREATDKMLEKARSVRISNARFGDETDPDEYYRAMLAASPVEARDE
jgi:hypothetical protein